MLAAREALEHALGELGFGCGELSPGSHDAIMAGDDHEPRRLAVTHFRRRASLMWLLPSDEAGW
jgi:hypothetical protein